jgi:hypothetical protein
LGYQERGGKEIEGGKLGMKMKIKDEEDEVEGG